MAFNSFGFIFIFLPLVYLIYFFAVKKSENLSALFLAVSSIIFYSFWNWHYVPLLLFSILTNYFLASKIEISLRKKFYLISALIFNFGILIYYKIINFLPLGISFWTFTQIGFLTEIYRRSVKMPSLLKYFESAAFFPVITSGPILNYKNYSWGGENVSKISYENTALGITLFILGLFKKIYIADNLSPFVNNVFNNMSMLTFFDAWAAALGYAAQLYFDFSGYSDMAVGLGLMFNKKLPVNFNSPYKSLSIIDFWRRWHISLGTWIKNYIYIPLGGSREGEVKKIRNVILVMLFTGLWHGLGCTFILWGALHGLMLAVNHQWRRLNIKLPKIISWLLTFLCVIFCWVIFRAENLNDAAKILKAMINFNNIALPDVFASHLSFLKNFGISFALLKTGFRGFLYIPCAVLIALICPNTQELINKFKPGYLWLIIIFIIAVVSFMNFSGISDFLYFQF